MKKRRVDEIFNLNLLKVGTLVKMCGSKIGIIAEEFCHDNCHLVYDKSYIEVIMLSKECKTCIASSEHIPFGHCRLGMGDKVEIISKVKS